MLTVRHRKGPPSHHGIRFGFIKMALQYGYEVHPVYTFGEEYAYHAFPGLLQLRLKLNEYMLPGVVFFGRLNCCRESMLTSLLLWVNLKCCHESRHLSEKMLKSITSRTLKRCKNFRPLQERVCC